MVNLKFKQRELRLARSAEEVIWWFEKFGSDSEGLVTGERRALDKLRKALAVYENHGACMPLVERVDITH
jgi:hypothetical protein